MNSLSSGNLLVHTVIRGRIWNFIQIEYRIEYHKNFEYELNVCRIESEYSVAPDSIRILNGVEMSCRDRIAGEFYTSLFCEVYSFK